MRRIVITLSIMLLLAVVFPVSAQDNLLTNGGLEQGDIGPYQGKGRADLTVPVGWDLWLGQGSTDQFYNRGDKVASFPHPGPGPDPAEGRNAANLSGGYVQFNAAYFQTVGVAPGTILRAEAASQIKVCNIPEGQVTCGSDLGSGGQTRIGIDPDGGSDPNASEIIWSGWLQPHDRWDRQSVEATASGGQVTVFIYATQGAPYQLNRVYWDDVKLTAVGAGEVPAGGGGAAAPPPTPVPQFVPFVNPQGEQDDGSITHVVGQGDTLDSIAVAYGLTRQDLVDRNPNLQSIRFLQIGQRIIIQTPEPTPEPQTASTPIPGGVATAEPTEEVAEAVATEESEDGDVVINADPKGLEAIPEDDPESQDLLDAMGDLLGGLEGAATEESAEEPQEAVTEEATKEVPTEEATVEETPTEEPVAVPTEEVPVVAAETVPEVDIAASTVAVCVSLFEDNNQNRLRESNEVLLGGGTVILNTSTGDEAATYDTDGRNEPHCFTDLEVGEYIAIVAPPEGYGLTTPNQLRLPLTSGTSLNIEFGAAEGVEVAVVPPPDAGEDTSANVPEEATPEQPRTLSDNLIAISGIVVAVLAGIVVIAGIGATILLRRGR